MHFPPDVLRWAGLTGQELTRGAYPFPSEFILSVIRAESGGTVGQVNPNSGASGLMQIMPTTLDSYNRNNAPDIPLWQLRARDPQYAPEQIRVGLWVLGKYLKKSFKWLNKTNSPPAISDLMKIDTLMYLRGPGRIYDKFGHLSDRSYDNLKANFPEWRFFSYTDKIWKWTTVTNDAQFDENAIESWIAGETEPPPLPPPEIATGNGLLAGLLVIAIASWYFSKHA